MGMSRITAMEESFSSANHLKADTMSQILLQGCRITESLCGVVRRWLASGDYIEGNTRDQIENYDAQLEKSHSGVMNGIKMFSR